MKPKIHFLLDYCPDNYRELISLTIPKSWDVTLEFTKIGINETMLRAYQIAKEQDDDILFQECDYLYTKNSGNIFIEGLNELEMVSPYDHLNFYIDRTLHSPNVAIKLINNHHWRSTERNTMTFALKNNILKKHYSIFRHYGYLDGNVWYDLLERGHMLWVPIPSIATHMVRDYLAPSINWKEIWQNINIQ